MREKQIISEEFSLKFTGFKNIVEANLAMFTQYPDTDTGYNLLHECSKNNIEPCENGFIFYC
jgi:hypothetical protein